jgi:aryl-phospho-beta-D-glucosidase BglC (GH1 family)
MKRMLSIKGSKIIDESNKEVFLRGYNIGNWMNLENFLMGYAGTEQQFRGLLEKYGGKEKKDYFFESFMEKSVSEKDLKFLRGMGCNVLRVPFNYRYFESDDKPFRFSPKGFKHLDWLVEKCKEIGIYVILDLHSAQGYQNTDWHCDNSTGETFYKKPGEQARMIELWKFVADHYKDEETVCAYELINEPSAHGEEEAKALDKLYIDTTRAIREVDKKHIIMLDGNMFGKNFEGFSAPFDDKLIYSVHCYSDAGHLEMRYPGDFETIVYDKGSLELALDERTKFIREHKVPCLVGEFGIRGNAPKYAEDRERVLNDQLDIFNERGYSWTLWNYKDIGLRGLVYLNPESKWMKFTENDRRLKAALNADQAVPVGEAYLIHKMRAYLGKYYPEYTSGQSFCFDRGVIVKLVMNNFSNILIDLFTRKMSKLALEELDGLAASFNFDHCLVREGWKKIIMDHLK